MAFDPVNGNRARGSAWLGAGKAYPIHQVDCVLHAEACLDPGEAGIGGDRLQRQGIADRPQVGGQLLNT